MEKLLILVFKAVTEAVWVSAFQASGNEGVHHYSCQGKLFRRLLIVEFLNANY